VDLLEPLADIFLMLLATLVEVDTRFIIGDPALAKVAELAALGLPIIRPAIRYHRGHHVNICDIDASAKCLPSCVYEFKYIIPL